MKIIVPTSLDDITIQQWIDLKKILSLENQSEDFIRLALISICCKISIEKVKLFSLDDYNDISIQVLNVIKEAENVSLRKIVNVNGIDYGFIPNLDKMSAGEYIDLDTYLDGTDDNIYNAMKVMYREVKGMFSDNYSIKKYNTEIDSEIYKDFPITSFLGASVFFCNLGKELLTHTEFLTLQEIQTREVSEEDLQINGGGINQYILLQMEELINLKRLLVYPFTNFLHSLNLK